MGAKSFRAAADAVVQRAEARVDKSCVATRYHRPPRRIEDDYIISEKILGRGSTGAVVAAMRKGSDQTFAVKTLHLRGISSETRAHIATEVELFLAMDHPHVVRLFDVYEADGELSFAMERMEGGELLDRVIKQECYSEPEAAAAAWQMLLCLNYIHSHGIVHRDVKLENFMYVRQDTDHLKLIDFGMSKIWDRRTKMEASCGTLSYIAPEVMDGSYTSQCDIWSFGVVMHMLIVGYMPFRGSEAHQMVCIMNGLHDFTTDEWKSTSVDARDFVQQLLTVDVTKRMTAEAALQHKWLTCRHQTIGTAHVVDTGVIEALRRFSQASKFRRACLSVMAWSLSHEERKSVCDAFLALDTSRQGTIKLWQLRDVLSETFHIEDKEVAQIFEALDTSHDEEIHYSAFLAAMISSRIKLHDKLLHDAFARFDTEGHGEVTQGGLRDLFGHCFHGKDLEDLLEEVNSRYAGALTYSDFVSYLHSGLNDQDHMVKANCMVDSKVVLGQPKFAGEPSVMLLRRKQSEEQPVIGERQVPTSPRGQKRSQEAHGADAARRVQSRALPVSIV
mmetsp:Transcript_42569/g.97618  ORF Transcript_42569/g.97618 Transcript_42569/m.97618 type:complete len:560 (-) Transcript_42569:272-1951(-)